MHCRVFPRWVGLSSLCLSVSLFPMCKQYAHETYDDDDVPRDIETNERTNERTDERTNERTNERTIDAGREKRARACGTGQDARDGKDDDDDDGKDDDDAWCTRRR